jgi:hypothetical protein
MFNAVYDRASSKFLTGGTFDPVVDPTVQGVVSFPDTLPNFVTERFDAVLGKRPATAAELAADAAAALDAQASIDMTKALQAVAIALLEQSLGRVSTAAERQALLARVKTIYKGL